MTRIRVRAFTDTGLQRNRNEDAILVGGWLCQTHSGSVAAMEFDIDAPFVCAVADGMGGHVGGDLASRVALRVISELCSSWRTPQEVSDALAEANQRVREVGHDPELQGLGTTIAGICIAGNQLIAFNIGDSRVYSISSGFLQQVSVDDSLPGENGRPSNLVTQSLGQPKPVEPHVTLAPLRASTYLICSDGVSGVMSSAHLRAAALKADIAACANSIIETTRNNGARDNFSFVLVDIPSPRAATAPVADQAASSEAVAVVGAMPSTGGISTGTAGRDDR